MPISASVRKMRPITTSIPKHRWKSATLYLSCFRSAHRANSHTPFSLFASDMMKPACKLSVYQYASTFALPSSQLSQHQASGFLLGINTKEGDPCMHNSRIKIMQFIPSKGIEGNAAHPAQSKKDCKQPTHKDNGILPTA